MSIAVSVTLNSSVDGLQLPPYSSGRVLLAQSDEGGGNPGTVVVLEASEGTIDFGDVTPGAVIIENLDDTNFVEWGFATGVRPGRIPPRPAGGRGFPTLIYLDSSATLYVKADTADCKILVAGYNA